MTQPGGIRLGYLTGRYPAVSHAFIMREVAALRDLGLPVVGLTVHRTPPAALLTEDDRAEDARTFAILPLGPVGVLAAHAEAFLRRPGRYVSTLVAALRGGRPGLRGRLWQAFYFTEALALWRHCRRAGIRHLHAQFSAPGPDIAMLLCRFANDPGRGRFTWSMAIHGPVEFYDIEGYRLPEKAADAMFVTCIGDFARSQLMAFLPPDVWPRLHVVRCGVDPAVYREAPPPPAEPDVDLRILTVGRLVPFKGHALLLDAIAALRADGLRVRAEFVGDGPERAALEARARRLGIEDLVLFAGPVGQDRIREHYAACDVFCLPSFAEGIPVVLMEAMATGRPVVSTRIMGIPELVQDGRSGLLVPPARADEIARALRTLACDGELRAAMAREGRARVLEEFDVRQSAQRLADLMTAAVPGVGKKSEEAPGASRSVHESALDLVAR